MGNRRSRSRQLQQADEACWELIRTEPRPASRDVVARGIGERRFQLIVAPSFEDASAWEVRECREWQLIRLRVVQTWPDVLLIGHEPVPFESAILATYFDRITALSLSLRPDMSGQAGLDGTMYELAVFGDMYSGWRFQWWSESPKEWKPLVKLADEILKEFTKASG